MRTTHRITTEPGSFVVLVLIRFWRHFVENCYFGKFVKTFPMCFFKVKYYFGHISGMVGPIDVKRKGSALIGYCVQYVTLTFDLTHDLDLGCFKVKFRNSAISGIVGLIDVKWKGSELIWYWADELALLIYRIVTGVTSDVGVPSTYLVPFVLIKLSKFKTIMSIICVYVVVHLLGDIFCQLGPLLLTWFNFNPSMDK